MDLEPVLNNLRDRLFLTVTVQRPHRHFRQDLYRCIRVAVNDVLHQIKQRDLFRARFGSGSCRDPMADENIRKAGTLHFVRVSPSFQVSKLERIEELLLSIVLVLVRDDVLVIGCFRLADNIPISYMGQRSAVIAGLCGLEDSPTSGTVANRKSCLVTVGGSLSADHRGLVDKAWPLVPASGVVSTDCWQKYISVVLVVESCVPETFGVLLALEGGHQLVWSRHVFCLGCDMRNVTTAQRKRNVRNVTPAQQETQS